MTGHTLVLAYPGCIAYEVMLATELIHPRHPVRVASPDGAAIPNSNGMRIASDTAYADVDPARFACILAPGGDPGAIMENPEVDRILGGCDGVIGGVCAGVLVMAKAGVLKGRRITHNYLPAWGATEEMVHATAPFWKGAQRIDAPVVTDGKLVTALPNASVEFAVTVARLLDVVDDARAAELRAYYRS